MISRLKFSSEVQFVRPDSKDVAFRAIPHCLKERLERNKKL